MMASPSSSSSDSQQSPLSLDAFNLNPYPNGISPPSKSPPGYMPLEHDHLVASYQHPMPDSTYSPPAYSTFSQLDAYPLQPELANYEFGRRNSMPLPAQKAKSPPPVFAPVLSPPAMHQFLARRGSAITEASFGDGSDEEGEDRSLSLHTHDLPTYKHRKRTSAHQLVILEQHFVNDPKPDINARKMLSAAVGMTPREVQVWFQNRRAKVKKQAKQADNAVARGESIAPSRRASQDINATMSRTPSSFMNPFNPPSTPYNLIPPHLPHHSLLDMRRSSMPAVPTLGYAPMAYPSSNLSSFPETSTPLERSRQPSLDVATPLYTPISATTVTSELSVDPRFTSMNRPPHLTRRASMPTPAPLHMLGQNSHSNPEELFSSWLARNHVSATQLGAQTPGTGVSTFSSNSNGTPLSSGFTDSFAKCQPFVSTPSYQHENLPFVFSPTLEEVTSLPQLSVSPEVSYSDYSSFLVSPTGYGTMGSLSPGTSSNPLSPSSAFNMDLLTSPVGKKEGEQEIVTTVWPAY